jgi:hypothetical protein
MTTAEPLAGLQVGDAVRVIYQGRHVAATILIASANGKSLMLEFDAMLGGFVRTMPVSWHDDHYEDLIRHEVVTVTREKRGA